jgi:ubiquinone/menaquinone biosynthesis C-methylase UbiE
VPLSQATKNDIEFLKERLRPGPETKLADLGCGGGCIGRYFAKEFGADVDGIDVDPLAVCMAEELAHQAGMRHHLRFKTGDIAKTGWIDNAFDGAISMDVLLFVANKPAALREICRILRPGARFAGMTWELRAASAALTAPAFVDYPGAFVEAGFIIEVYEETSNWRRLLTDALGTVVTFADAIRTEVEAPAAERLLAWARTRPSELDQSRRVRFCVRREL